MSTSCSYLSTIKRIHLLCSRISSLNVHSARPEWVERFACQCTGEESREGRLYTVSTGCVLCLRPSCRTNHNILFWSCFVNAWATHLWEWVETCKVYSPEKERIETWCWWRCERFLLKISGCINDKIMHPPTYPLLALRYLCLKVFCVKYSHNLRLPPKI